MQLQIVKFRERWSTLTRYVDAAQIWWAALNNSTGELPTGVDVDAALAAGRPRPDQLRLGIRAQDTDHEHPDAPGRRGAGRDEASSA